MERGEQYVQNPLDAINTTITKTTLEDEKCAGNVNKILVTLMNVNF